MGLKPGGNLCDTGWVGVGGVGAVQGEMGGIRGAIGGMLVDIEVVKPCLTWSQVVAGGGGKGLRVPIHVRGGLGWPNKSRHFQVMIGCVGPLVHSPALRRVQSMNDGVGISTWAAGLDAAALE
jgi:hypothetical protein